MKSFICKLTTSFYLIFFLISIQTYAQTVMFTDDFESGWGNWNDGGYRCDLTNPSPLNLGTSVALSDNSGSASSTYTNDINLSSYTSASIQYSYRVTNFSNGEDFFLEFSNNGGTSWSTLKTYVKGSNLNNNQNYIDTQTVTSAGFGFSNNSQFRFRCDASNTQDIVYLDNIVVRVYGGGPEIDVRGNNISIPDGDTTPNTSDNTDYGTINVGTMVTKSFTIHNSGSTDLIISSIILSNNTDFTIVGTPYSTPITQGNNTSFSLGFNTLTTGLKSTMVTINNNDSNEGNYSFQIHAGAEQNFFDSDGDGIYDNVDIDDDNDGITDIEEELACKNSSISVSTSYKFLKETFGTGARTTINTTYDAVTTYTYEDGTDGGNGTDLNDGKYTVYSNAQIASWASEYWYLGVDHTPGDSNGRMALFNASYDPGLFYTASIKGALPNVPVTYSFWVLNLDHSNAPGIGSRLRPKVRVEFRDTNNNLLTSISTGPIAPTTSANLNGDWYNFTADLTFDVSEFNVYFINDESGGLGNDLAIDDIEITQTLCDTDGDGVADLFDLDSDNDGIPDVVEAGLGYLSDGKATLLNNNGWVDANNNGMHDFAEGHITLDSDGDGTPNYLDLDSDNDAIFDVDESGAGNIANVFYQNGDGDIDGDGIGDGPDTDNVRMKDFNSDNSVEYFPDGILDIYDYFVGNSFNTAYGNKNQGNGFNNFVQDTDGDGLPDYIDITSDGSTFDISHTLYSNMDAYNNGIVDGSTDADRDGLLDLFDTNDAVFGSPRDLSQKLQLYFDGRNDYAQDISVINGWGESTIMTWIKVGSTNQGKMRVLGQNQFYMDINPQKKITAYGKGVTVVGSNIIYGQWTHVAATYSSSTGELKLYVNGSLVGSEPISGNLPTDTSLFTIGRSSSENDRYFTGYYDEVRVFDKALTADELQKIVYQEIKNNGGIVRGEIIPKDVTNFVSTTNNMPLNWTNLKRYFKMDTYKGNIIDDLTTTAVDVTSGARIYNAKLIDAQSAPLPFVTYQSGDLSTAVTDIANGVNGDDVITYDWSIVHVKHNNISYSGTQKHLGLFVDEYDSTLNPIQFNVQNDSELNVSWYLKLDGAIDLEGESQLVQGLDSTLDPTSKGKIERDQQGTADKFTYNYWGSPVGIINTTSNNNSYRVRDVMRDGINNINWVSSGYNGTNTSPIGIADYWIWKYANLPNNSYASWQHIRSTGTIRAGEGFTMKGPGTGTILANQNYVFTGKPNNGDITLTLNAGNDYLVANPYPSALDGRQFILDNINVIAGNGSTSGTIYFWEHWGGGSHVLSEYQGGYATYNLSGATPSASFGTNDPNVGTGGTPTKLPGRYIPVSQGFFVVAEGSGGTIKFNNGQRIFAKEGNSNSVFIRSSEATTTTDNPDDEDLRMKFRIGFNSVNTIHRQILLTVDDLATEGVDRGYDALYIDNQMDDMYWMINNEKYNIQGINQISETSIVPIGLHLRDGGQNTISIDYLENVPNDVAIYAHDKVLDYYHDLRQSAYTFTLPSGVYLDRYEITFQADAALGIDENILTQLEIYYANEHENLVLVNPKLEKIKSIELFNMLGQSIHTINKVEKLPYAEYKIKNLSTGTYIVKMFTESGSTSKKVLVK